VAHNAHNPLDLQLGLRARSHNPEVCGSKVTGNPLDLEGGLSGFNGVLVEHGTQGMLHLFLHVHM
jgi:hypothetical protein